MSIFRSVKSLLILGAALSTYLPARVTVAQAPARIQASPSERRATPASDSHRWNQPSAAVMTIDEAVQIALLSNLSLQSQRLDVDNAKALIKEGWAELYPTMDISSSFTRLVRAPNPFAGSQAGGLFQTLGFIDWLAFNEQARTDGNASSNPISLSDFFLKQQAGLDAAGISLATGDNPFTVPNSYRSTLSVSQKLFDGRVIVGATGAAKWLEPFNSAGVRRQEQLLVNDVKKAFYDVLLARQQTAVLTESVARADQTRKEMAHQVSVGTAPKFQRLSAEVNLANLESQATAAESKYASALDGLKLLIGIPVEQDIELRGSLESDATERFSTVSLADAATTALEHRPDLEQARINIELQNIQLKVARSEFLPDLSAFLNLNYVGSVPDNRRLILSDPSDPFSFSSRQNGYFSSDYWDWDLNVGFRLSWNIFNGFASKSHVQQKKIALQRASLDHEFLADGIKVEIERAIRDVRVARRQMISQEKTVSSAELNFSFASSRLHEGVASAIEVREASSQLDQSRLNYLQATHDFLVARSAYQTALGTPDLSVVDPIFSSK